VYAVIPADDARGKALKKLLSPKIPGADWRAISATKPPNGALGTLLDELIKEVIPANSPYCRPFDTAQTIDGILGTTDNDAIGTRSSQLADIDADHSQWFPNLSHAPLLPSLFDKLLALFKLTEDNVPESPAVWKVVCQWLSPNSVCPTLPSAAQASAATAAPANKNAIPMPHIVAKHPRVVDRLSLRAPAGLVLGKAFDLAVSTGRGGLPELHVVQSSQTGAQKEVPVTILRVEGQTVHLNVTPKLYGDTRFQVIAAYPDGGVATKEVAANVNMPALSQDGFHADELPVAGMPIVVAGKPNDPRNPTLRLQPWNSISVFNTNMRAYIPDTSQVQFTIDPASGSSVIELSIPSRSEPRRLKRSTPTRRTPSLR
jgi:hypothetical protein